MHINWKRTIIILLDLVLAVYIAMAFTVFHTPDEAHKVCAGVNIDIQDKTSQGFIDAKEIKARLENKKLYPLSKPMKQINTRLIEDFLKQSPFVKTVECYKTQDNNIYITLTQRMPTVRIKAANGDDYYIDDNFQIMPNSHYTSDLIIATGNISKQYARHYVSHLCNVLMADEFWKNQIVQINVLPSRGIELIPRVGNHIIYIGPLPEAGNQQERDKQISNFVKHKLDVLEKFYRYGLSQAGWNKYAYINIEFDNQIICKKHPVTPQPVVNDNEE